MGALADITATFLRAQVDAGVDAVQLFDSWAGALSERDYREFVLPHSARVLAAVADAGVPRIHFGVGTGELLGAMAEAGADVVGVDWRVPLHEAALRGPGVAVQGNLDPAVLFADPARSRPRCAASVAEGRAAPGHVFNLGHGVLPETDPDVLTAAGRARAQPWAVTSMRVAVVGGRDLGLGRRTSAAGAAGPGGRRSRVLEQRDRIGGVLRTVDLAGVPYDVGAEAFLARRPEVARPARRARAGRRGWCTRRRRAPRSGRRAARCRCPAARCSVCRRARPGSPVVLSDAGRRRSLPSPTGRCAWTPGGDVALGGLLRDRFGDELADRLADPLLGGVYAGRVDALGLRATMPASPRRSTRAPRR